MRFLTAFLALAALLATTAAPAAAVAQTHSDPHGPGPHALADARHAHQQFGFAPPRSAPIGLVPHRRTAAAGAAGTGAAGGAGATMTKEVMGFAPYWALSQQSSFQYGLMTTVDYFGITVNGDGSFDTTDGGWTGWGSQDLVNLINSAHQSGDRVVLTIKQFDEATINSIVTNQAYTQAAITGAINAIASKNLDGINVDFEGYTSSSYPNIQQGMTNFMAQLTAQTHHWRSNTMVSIDTYSGSASWNGGIFNISALAPNVDDFFVMAYDMWSGNEPSTGPQYALPNAPLTGWTYNDTGTVQQYVSQAPAGKVILGVPYYGVKWSTLGNNLNSEVNPSQSGFADPSYADVQSDIQCAQQHNLNFSSGWDPHGYSPYAAWYSPASGDPCGGNHGSWREEYYDDAASLGYKYDLVNQSGIRGAGMWALGDDSGYNDLWNEIAVKFTVAPAWSSLGGTLSGPAAVSTWPGGHMDVFASGNGGAVWHRWWNGSGWSGWDDAMGGVAAPGTGPAAVSWSQNRIDLFVDGTDGTLQHAWWDGAWHGWESLGGQLTSSPAVASYQAGRLDVFGRGTDGALWHKYYQGGWSGWESLGGALKGAPAAATFSQSHLDVFVRGTDDTLWHKWWYGAGWSNWESLGGQLTSAPAASSWGQGRFDVVALGAGGALEHLYWNGQWSTWLNDGGQGTSDPAVADWAPNAIAGFVRGTDDALWTSPVPP